MGGRSDQNRRGTLAKSVTKPLGSMIDFSRYAAGVQMTGASRLKYSISTKMKNEGAPEKSLPCTSPFQVLVEETSDSDRVHSRKNRSFVRINSPHWTEIPWMTPELA